MNNEAKARRKTKSDILGKARVMTYNDLEAARVKRAEKEAAKEAKGKGIRGRKLKSAPPETEEATADKGKRGAKRKNAEPEPVAPELDVPELTAKVPRTSGTQAAEVAIAPGPWRAPVARMW
ncbi:hypothetical protein AOQ84DRAFT_222595 [Glonium stellatum]|uniref:Uncharacterized protein n=1 Tax=Glonium stellatum TaxID=574774 RepID=A0A8E2EZF4_9PEZI|nr:hypothetical protein AOQ84DRAFT_222595 [Glonium stellatum]